MQLDLGILFLCKIHGTVINRGGDRYVVGEVGKFGKTFNTPSVSLCVPNTVVSLTTCSFRIRNVKLRSRKHVCVNSQSFMIFETFVIRVLSLVSADFSDVEHAAWNLNRYYTRVLHTESNSKLVLDCSTLGTIWRLNSIQINLYARSNNCLNE